MIGSTISHYKVLEKIGEGGMGIVYQAQDTMLDRTVALKFLPQYLASDSHEKERFFHEAKAASALNHPNITTIYEIAEFEGQVYIAMEYVEGKTLKHLLEAETVSIKKALDIAIQVCDGLSSAREKGIIHRDIKSDNLMLTSKGQVKIMDFGLAKLKGATKLTKAGTTLGTAAYMSPEQASGEEVDHRTDIFSFGVVLYELLTSKLPFGGEHQSAIIYSILNEEPQPVARYNNKVSPKLQEIVEKALAKDREERYQHIEDLQADLRRERKSFEYARTPTLTQPVEAQKPVKKKMLPFVLAGLGILILILGYLAFFNKKTQVSTGSGKPSMAVLYLQNLSENKEDEYFAAGMTEDIITQLSKISGLRVTSRSDVEEFKGKPVKLKEVAEKLKVDYVMEGSVRKYGDKLRITCQLIQSKDGFHVWAENYDRQMQDLFAIQADVAKQVAQALEIALAPTEIEKIEKKPTLNVQAYNYYLQGREYYFGGATSKERLGLAIKMFEKALEADSNFALAYAGLSDCYSSYVMFGIDPKKSWLEKAEKTSLKALALDQNLAEAHRSLSRLYFTEGKNQKAFQEAKAAVQANPNYAEAWRLLGNWYEFTGQYPEAEQALMKALELKPTQPGIFGAFMDLYSLQGERKKVEEYFNKGLEIQPSNAGIYSGMAFWLLFWGELEEAKKMAHKALSVDPQNGEANGGLMFIFLMTETPDSAFYYLNRIRQQNLTGDLYVEMARVAFMKGEKRQAEIYLDSCIQFNQPLIKEFENLPEEYRRRLRIGLVYALKGETKKALAQAEKVSESLGDSLLTIYSVSSFSTFFVQDLSEIYSLTGQKEKAVSMLKFLVEKNCMSPAFIKLHPFYKNLAGYPEFEALVNRRT